MSETDERSLSLGDLERCFGGAIPAVLATASGDGTPNVTYLSRAHAVDAERLALSNQFLSKTARNLAENPRASLLLIDPLTHDEYRLALVYERTERRGPVFERLRHDVDVLASLTGMQDVFRLRAADIYRVVEIEQVPANPAFEVPAVAEPGEGGGRDPRALATVVARLSRCTDLDTLVDATVDALDTMLGYRHVHLMLLDETGTALFTIASRGFDADSVGSEVMVGEGLIGMAAARSASIRVGNLVQIAKYARTVRRSFEVEGGIGPGREIPMPGLAGTESRVVVPAMARGELVGVLVADSTRTVAFDENDEAVLEVVASVVAHAVEALRADEAAGTDDASPPEPTRSRQAIQSATVVRFFAFDGSTFLDHEYLIKGVAGRILWSLLRQHHATGRTEFTNRELRLDPTLEMPGFKDNLESRLLLLKRRLDERDAPVRIERTGRGRFRLDVSAPLELVGDEDGG